MTAVWFTSDLHIGHEKVSLIRGFSGSESTEEHDRALAEAWDARVAPKDHVWILGDMSAGGTAAQGHALSWLANRPGVKHLIAGNHDGCHPMHRNAYKWHEIYLTVFDTVQSIARRKINGQSVLLSHFPYDGDHYDRDRHTQYRLPDMGVVLLHGHTHASGVITHSLAGSLQISVGVDAWSLGPVHLDEIASLFS